MPNNLGRDNLPGWNAQVWTDIDQAVLDEVGRIRVAQKVFHSENTPNANNVPADEFNLFHKIRELSNGPRAPETAPVRSGPPRKAVHATPAFS